MYRFFFKKFFCFFYEQNSYLFVRLFYFFFALSVKFICFTRVVIINCNVIHSGQPDGELLVGASRPVRYNNTAAECGFSYYILFLSRFRANLYRESRRGNNTNNIRNVFELMENIIKKYIAS